MEHDNLAHSKRLIDRYADELELKAAKDQAFRMAEAARHQAHPDEFPDVEIGMTPSDLLRFTAMTTTGKLQRLLARCKAGVHLTINEHRDYYHSAEHALEDLACHSCPPEIDPEVRAQIIASDTIVDLTFYPDTPIGSYQIVHHDLDRALDIALRTLEL